MTPTTVAAYPALFRGIRPNSVIASALVKARIEEAARTWRITSGRSDVLRGATDMATNSRPVSAAAQPAIVANSSR
jgi:hypothetical protein